jgi:hypothetical protein
MARYFTPIGRTLWRLAMSYAVPAGSRKLTVTLNFVSESGVYSGGGSNVAVNLCRPACNNFFMWPHPLLFRFVSGALQARDYRSPSCMTYGNGSHVMTLGINLLANNGAPDYCGVLVNNVSTVVTLTELLLLQWHEMIHLRNTIVATPVGFHIYTEECHTRLHFLV